ncbi:2-methylaconitate cis-trans isomerase PrpF [Rhodoplanes sp. TEM]|uniref:2-methylaconitate cis-trans isomerase PrpF n=1 Tax=Rhodoplanes tepidamans TaxID=200616 RepID=A0ABT5JCU7_RHOTP|nr:MULTISPECIES: 2-methylaconitate cis-trans isomerase PrpF [Rhodoplanes]MDC7787494.1 2-methylaconitate cis-trans isomerase PrpF [Rhodoplanes tepidamans]MDC7983915.1 2-methylaconitate cis-trans isomerase PrpF [Rhodoplanes sp. TEM]MDQ0354354.1 putative AcnD-accessory protein PrpF [Rhodoplanes tepidamans]
MTASRIPAVYMRGGTSKGVFFHARDLPADPAARDRVLLRVTGSPDPYGKQIDGMGAATSSTSKVVLVSPSPRPDCDVAYLFGQVAIEAPLIDWSGNCGNLTTAVGPFAIAQGLVPAGPDGIRTVRLWQANLGKRIVAHVPVRNGEVVEEGDFLLDGVAFPAAEIRLEFIDPGGGVAGVLPTGRAVDVLDVPGLGRVEASLVDAGNPTVIVAAAALGVPAALSQAQANGDAAFLARCEAVRAAGAVAMGLARTADEATASRPATPKVALVGPPAGYVAASGRAVAAADVDLVARMISMGKLHHALTGTGAVALAVAAALPGTLVSGLLGGVAAPDRMVRLGHASGVLPVGAEAAARDGTVTVEKAVLSRSARCLMEGVVRVPADMVCEAAA